MKIYENEKLNELAQQLKADLMEAFEDKATVPCDVCGEEIEFELEEGQTLDGLVEVIVESMIDTDGEDATIDNLKFACSDECFEKGQARNIEENN